MSSSVSPRRPLKIAVLRRHEDGSYWTRCYTPLLWLLRQNAIEIIPPMHAWEADVVVLHGQWHPGVPEVIRSLRRHGIRVVVDADEDILGAPPAEVDGPDFDERVRRIFSGADAVFVPTENLAAKLADLNSKVSVTPNGIDLAMWRRTAPSKPRDEVRVIGFAGCELHRANVEILRPALAKLSELLWQKQIRFVCFGFKPSWLSEVLPGSEVVPECAPEKYSLDLAGLGFDIALAPLVDSEANRCRSALKFWEYTAAGAAVVASKVGPYASAIEHRATGLLVNNDPESWTEAIRKLIQNDRLRRELLESAQRSLEAHDVSRTAPVMLEALEATAPNRERVLFSFPRTQASAREDVDIIIPIYNSPALAKQAIESALPELDANHRLILVDDASPDPAVGTMLEEYTGRPWVTVHRCPKNNGFVGTCNLAVQSLARPEADVILMNADTQPMRGFVHRLAGTAGSNPLIGTVTAVSNEGWIASVPDLRDADQLAALEHPLILSPTACGFLFYIKREVLDKYGLFDAAYSPGYCEELDLSLRISGEYANVIDTGCWTWHANSASFGDAKFKLSLDHNAEIDRRYPHFRFELAAFNATRPLLDHRMRMVHATRDPRPRVLHVLHQPGAGHGTGKHAHNLSAALSDRYLSFQVCATEAKVPEQERLELHCGEVLVKDWPYTQPGWPLTTPDLPSNNQLWDSLLSVIKPSLIHFHHLKNHALSLLARMTATGIPTVVALHDYYMVCPDFALMQCPGVHSCDTCFPDRFHGPADYQRLRRALCHESLKSASAIVAPSRSAADLIRDVYSGLNILVIPHGLRAFPKVERKPSSKVRFGMIGSIAAVKGIEVLLKAWKRLSPSSGAELHIHGFTEPAYLPYMKALGIQFHGAYCEGDLPRILSEIDVGLLPSQAPETFNYTLSEFFACGVPVIGSDYGALSERIQHGVNGLKVVKDDVQAWVSALSTVIRDHELRDRLSRGVRPPGSIQEMAARYDDLYREVLTKKQREAGSTVSAAMPAAAATAELVQP